MPRIADNKRLGIKAADFNLMDTISGNNLTLSDCRAEKGFLMMIICNHCPYVVHVEDELARLGMDYKDSGIGIAAMSANDADKYPSDGPTRMRERAFEKGYEFPYLYDETQRVARAYHAECTPDFLLFNSELSCVYSGRLCESTPGNGIQVTANELRRAMDACISQTGTDQILSEQRPSMGCSIKWKQCS